MPAGPLFKVVPPLVGPADKGDVRGVLVIGPADDPRVAMRAAAVVDQGKLLQGQDGPAAAGQLERGRRAHAAGADQDDIKCGVWHNGGDCKPPAADRSRPWRPPLPAKAGADRRRTARYRS